MDQDFMYASDSQTPMLPFSLPSEGSSVSRIFEELLARRDSLLE